MGKREEGREVEEVKELVLLAKGKGRRIDEGERRERGILKKLTGPLIVPDAHKSPGCMLQPVEV